MRIETRGRKPTAYVDGGKRCARCGEVRPLTSFNKKRNREAAYCKECDTERALEKLSEEELKERISKHRKAVLKLVRHLQSRNK